MVQDAAPGADEGAVTLGAKTRWRLHEPTTTLTDLAITLVAGWLALRLLAATSALAPALLAGALTAVALAALVGAAVHGVGPQLGERRKGRLWLLTLQLAVLSNALLLGAVAAAHAPPRWRAGLLAAVAAKLLVVGVLVWRRREFRRVVYDSVLTLLAVAGAAAAAWALRGAPSAPWMLGGVAVSVVAGAVQQRGLTLHRHFNHNDLYHVVQLVGVYLFYRGGLLLAAG